MPNIYLFGVGIYVIGAIVLGVVFVIGEMVAYRMEKRRG